MPKDSLFHNAGQVLLEMDNGAGMSQEMGELLLRDLRARTASLEALDGPLPKQRPQVAAFAH